MYLTKEFRSTYFQELLVRMIDARIRTIRNGDDINVYEEYEKSPAVYKECEQDTAMKLAQYLALFRKKNAV